MSSLLDDIIDHKPVSLEPPGQLNLYGLCRSALLTTESQLNALVSGIQSAPVLYVVTVLCLQKISKVLNWV